VNGLTLDFAHLKLVWTFIGLAIATAQAPSTLTAPPDDG